MSISEKEIIERRLFSDTSQYNDIMDKHWKRPANRPAMTPQERAGQFAPFAALTGFGKLINDTANTYAKKDYLPAKEEKKVHRQLCNLARTHQPATFNFFDENSAFYMDFQDNITVIKPERGRVFFQHHPSIPIANIRKITVNR